MPELPEVETVRLQLLRTVVGKKIIECTVLAKKSTGDDPLFKKRLLGSTISHIERIGKLLIFNFKDASNLFVLCHLKMTGQFFYVANGKTLGGGHSMSERDFKNLPNAHTRIFFTFEDATQLFFNDMRLFGYMKIATANEVLAARSRFGEEPIHTSFDFPAFFARLHKRHTTIKAALLDQTLIAGLGNIYVDEALFATKILPDRRADTLTRSEVKALVTAGGKIMNHSITLGGTTFQHFLDTAGQTGNYTTHLRVFGKQGTRCSRCKKGTIQKTRVAGRGTHFCPNCQK